MISVKCCHLLKGQPAKYKHQLKNHPLQREWIIALIEYKVGFCQEMDVGCHLVLNISVVAFLRASAWSTAPDLSCFVYEALFTPFSSSRGSQINLAFQTMAPHIWQKFPLGTMHPPKQHKAIKCLCLGVIKWVGVIGLFKWSRYGVKLPICLPNTCVQHKRHILRSSQINTRYGWDCSIQGHL